MHACRSTLEDPTTSGAAGPATCTPPSGSTFPLGTTTVTCSVTNACGLSASCSFRVTVRRYHIGPPWWTWPCDPALLADGLPHVPLNGATLRSGPVPDLPGIGPVGGLPAYELAPSADGRVAEVAIHTGNAQLFAFTTVLDTESPDGSTIEITDPTDPAGVPLLTLEKTTGGSGWNCKTCCHWDLKKCKGLISDDPAFRTSAVNPGGELLGSFAQTFNEGNTNAALSLWVTDEDDQTKFPVTILFDRTDGTIHVDFPGTVQPAGLRDSRRKGWDGVVKGRPPGSARRGWDGTVKGRPPEASRVTFTPFKPHAVHGEVMHLAASGLKELLLTAATIGVMGDPKTGQPILPVRSRDQASPQPFLGPLRSTARGDGVHWTALADDVGLSLDLGRALSVDVAFEHTALLLPPDGQAALEFRVGARPAKPAADPGRPALPPPTTYLRLAQAADGVRCTADFSYLAATDVAVQFRLKDALVSQFQTKGPAITADDKLLLDRWPVRFAQLNLDGVLRLTGEFSTPNGPADEIRFVPTLPPGVERPDHLGVLECTASEGVDGLLRDLRSTLACVPAALQISRDPVANAIVLEWAGAGHRLQGAETVSGPWLELDGTAPVTLPAGAPLRAFRLICE